MRRLSCAVYTRKSTEDGLEQEFNSLDAQREACEAYVRSQLHEGWELVSTNYDDGGFSGGNIDRPGLRALLADVDAGLVDVIVVYKVDRLTRSLADFAKIVERLDAKQASFVSITQAFNTTTSMGRLTLNVLLSFAQFEREVTSERIRDKIAASKKKGMWMGGPVPLGYKVVDRKLAPDPAEAEQVRHIMRRYIESSSANELLDGLQAEGVRTKVQQRVSGPHRGGIPFRRGSLFHLLKNPVYRGMIVHKENAYPGEHEAIVDVELWDAVQFRLAAKAPSRTRSSNERQQALLEGLITDPHGRPIVPRFTCKGSRRYRYYETRTDLTGSDKPTATRFPLRALDRHVVDEMRRLLADEHVLRRWSGLSEAKSMSLMFEQAARLGDLLGSEANWPRAIDKLISAIDVRPDHLDIGVKPFALGQNGTPGLWPLKIALPPRKPFRETKLRLDDRIGASAPVDNSMITLLREAHQVRRLILAAPGQSLNQLAKREGRCRKQMAKLLRVSWLSPRVVAAIVEGRLATRFDRKQLLEMVVPSEWEAQHQLFGIA